MNDTQLDLHIEELMRLHRQALVDAAKWAATSYSHYSTHVEFAGKIAEQIATLRRAREGSK